MGNLQASAANRKKTVASGTPAKKHRIQKSMSPRVGRNLAGWYKFNSILKWHHRTHTHTHTHLVNLHTNEICIQMNHFSDSVESIHSLEYLSVDGLNNFMRKNIGVKCVRYLLAKVKLDLLQCGIPPSYSYMFLFVKTALSWTNTFLHLAWKYFPG